MAKELGYVLVNPYTIRKSRTGGVLNRLLSWGKLSLVAARMYSPSQQLVDEYVETLKFSECRDEQEKIVLSEIESYLYTNYVRRKDKLPAPRVMLLLFEGEGAVAEIKRVTGHIARVSIGETIRGTYGDFIEGRGEIQYFEPAVLTATNQVDVRKGLKVWAKYAASDGGILTNTVAYGRGDTPERTLVLIKPDSFQELSSIAGNIVDRFSQTGLFIVGARVVQLSINQAYKFYEPIKERLAEKMRKALRFQLNGIFSREFDFTIPEDVTDTVAQQLKQLKTEWEFSKIIRFMTGQDPNTIPRDSYDSPGSEKCLALVYEGKEAINKIRTVLGGTNPADAAPGTVRKDFGHDVAKNAAHASDSNTSASRELAIVKVAEDDITRWVDRYYSES